MGDAIKPNSTYVRMRLLSHNGAEVCGFRFVAFDLLYFQRSHIITTHIT